MLALNYISVLATLAPKECVFSKAGNVLNVKWSRLLPKNIQRMISESMVVLSV